MRKTAYAVMPAYLTVSQEHAGSATIGRCYGTIWSQPGSAMDPAILMIADTPENRRKLASVGLLVQERTLAEVA